MSYTLFLVVKYKKTPNKQKPQNKTKTNKVPEAAKRQNVPSFFLYLLF